MRETAVWRSLRAAWVAHGAVALNKRINERLCRVL
jgi:hypothetical protein